MDRNGNHTARRAMAGRETVDLRVDFDYTYVYIVVRLMELSLFSQFAAMVERLPEKAIISAVMLQRKMLEDDLARKRTMPMEDVHSIIAFSEFLENVPKTARLPKAALPRDHLALYRATVKRLVEAGELPWESLGLFEVVFSVAKTQPAKAA
jgi:hypothetical protein